MRILLFLCALMVSLNAAAQTKARGGTVLRYVDSNSLDGLSDAVIVDDVPLVHTKQFLPLDNNRKIAGKGNLDVQFAQVLRNISQTLRENQSGPDQIIKLNVFVTNAEFIEKAQALISQNFDRNKRPTVTFAVGELAHKEALISFDAIAVSQFKSDHVKYSRSDGDMESSSAVLPAGPVVYISGQAAKGELAEATRNTLKQLHETLTHLGLSLKDVVQIKSFLTPMSSVNIVKKEFAEFFKNETIPPLVFVEWISADPLIEIELIAASPVNSLTTRQIDYITPPGMTASPVYSKVVRLNYGKRVYLSGIYGVNSGTADSEVNSIFDSMGKVLKASGSSFDKLLKATYYVGDDQFSKSLGALRPKYYDPESPPAASKAALREVGLNRKGISIDMIGTIKE